MGIDLNFLHFSSSYNLIVTISYSYAYIQCNPTGHTCLMSMDSNRYHVLSMFDISAGFILNFVWFCFADFKLSHSCQFLLLHFAISISSILFKCSFPVTCHFFVILYMLTMKSLRTSTSWGRQRKSPTTAAMSLSLQCCRKLLGERGRFSIYSCSLMMLRSSTSVWARSTSQTFLCTTCNKGTV